MINNYRVVLGYLKKVSGPPIRDSQAAAIVDILKNDPYKLRAYVRDNNIDVNNMRYTSILLQHVKSKAVARACAKAGLAPDMILRVKENPALAFDLINRGWVSPEDPEVQRALLERHGDPHSVIVLIKEKGWLRPENPEVKQALLEGIKKNPGYARVFIDRGWLKPEEAEVKEALLEVIKKYPSYAEESIDKGWLKPEDPGVKQALLEIIEGNRNYAGRFIVEGWVKVEDPGVKHALLESIKRDPGLASYYINRGFLTQAEVDAVLGARND